MSATLLEQALADMSEIRRRMAEALADLGVLRSTAQAVLDMADTLELQGETLVPISKVQALMRPLRAALQRDEFDEHRADVLGQNGNDGLHYVEADAGPTPLRGRITRRSE